MTVSEPASRRLRAEASVRRAAESLEPVEGVDQQHGSAAANGDASSPLDRLLRLAASLSVRGAAAKVLPVPLKYGSTPVLAELLRADAERDQLDRP